MSATLIDVEVMPGALALVPPLELGPLVLEFVVAGLELFEELLQAAAASISPALSATVAS
jgi:hypothetical protein